MGERWRVCVKERDVWYEKGNECGEVKERLVCVYGVCVCGKGRDVWYEKGNECGEVKERRVCMVCVCVCVWEGGEMSGMKREMSVER